MGAENLETPLDKQIGEFLEKAVALVSGQRGLVVTPIEGSADMQVRAAHNLAFMFWTVHRMIRRSPVTWAGSPTVYPRPSGSAPGGKVPA